MLQKVVCAYMDQKTLEVCDKLLPTVRYGPMSVFCIITVLAGNVNAYVTCSARARLAFRHTFTILGMSAAAAVYLSCSDGHVTCTPGLSSTSLFLPTLPTRLK
jgi:hypothetical protein